jgi:hypothetical protein
VPGIAKQLAVLKGSDTVAGDEFGESMAISGTTAVVGAPGSHKDAGRAYVFTDTTGAWKQTAELSGAHSSEFGGSVAISGTTAVVGSAGRAYMFTKTPSAWKQVAEFKGSDTGAGDFGSSVAISGTTAVVYAPVGNSYPRHYHGWAYVFTNAGGSWKQVAKLRQVDKPCPNPGGLGRLSWWGCPPENISGDTVAISGTTVLVASGSSATVFTKTLAGWKQTDELGPAVETGGDEPGVSSVAISGGTAVGGQEGVGSGCCTFVFTRTLSGWKQVTEMSPDLGGGFLGGVVAISGRTIVVGGEVGMGLHGQGRAFVFSQTVTGWKQAAVLQGSSSNFGGSVAISGSTAIVGGDSFAKGGGGRAYVFHV